MAGTIIGETKREGQRKAKRHTTCITPPKKKKLAPLMERNYLTHGPSNVTYMQTM